MNATYQILGLALTSLGLILTFYTIISRQNAAFKLQIENKLDSISKNSTLGFNNVTEEFNKMSLQINTILEGDIRELRGRIVTLESGQDEWTKTLRSRTHELANKVENLSLRFVLLENGIVLGKDKTQ